MRSPVAHGLIRSIDTQRRAGAAGRARGLHAGRSAPGPDRRPFAAAVSKLRAAAGYFAVHSGGQGGFIRGRGDCAGRGGQALYRRGCAGADRDGHSGVAGGLGLPRRAVGRRARRARPPQGQSADRFRPGLWRRRCRRGGGAAPSDRQSEAASRRRASDRGPRTGRELRCRERSADRLELNATRPRSPLFHHEAARARRKSHPRRHARRRRRIWCKIHSLSRRGGDLGGKPAAATAGQMDRGPARAFHGVDSGAGSILGRRGRHSTTTDACSARAER